MMPYRSNDSILEEWNGLLARAEALAKECQADPAQAALKGVQPVYPSNAAEDKAFGGVLTKRPENDKAAWLRGAAKRVVPDAFVYEVMEAIGGRAFLVLKSYKDT